MERTRTHYEIETSPDPNGNIPVAAIADFPFTVSSISPAYRFELTRQSVRSSAGDDISTAATYSGGSARRHDQPPQADGAVHASLQDVASQLIQLQVRGRVHLPAAKDCSHSYTERDETGRTLLRPRGGAVHVGRRSSRVRGFENQHPRTVRDQAGRTGPVGAYAYHAYNFRYILRIKTRYGWFCSRSAGPRLRVIRRRSISPSSGFDGGGTANFLPVVPVPPAFIYAFNPSKEPGDSSSPSSSPSGIVLIPVRFTRNTKETHEENLISVGPWQLSCGADVLRRPTGQVRGVIDVNRFSPPQLQASKRSSGLKENADDASSAPRT